MPAGVEKAFLQIELSFTLRYESATTNMPKRKRDSDDSDEGATGAKQQRIQFKLKQGTVKVGHAFKVAKGFERQKLGRRRKNAVTQKNEKDIQRIDAEIAALKVRAYQRRNV